MGKYSPEIAFTVFGTVLGLLVGSPAQGAALGYSVGSSIGKRKRRPGAGPTGLNNEVMSVGTGYTIPVVIGGAKLSGNVIWVGRIYEDMHASWAVGLCAGPVPYIGNIWLNDQSIGMADGNDHVTAYYGTETQNPDPTMTLEEADGISGSIPAHRGLAYLVFRQINLANWGNSIPAVTVEVGQPASSTQALVPITDTAAHTNELTPVWSSYCTTIVAPLDLGEVHTSVGMLGVNFDHNALFRLTAGGSQPAYRIFTGGPGYQSIAGYVTVVKMAGQPDSIVVASMDGRIYCVRADDIHNTRWTQSNWYTRNSIWPPPGGIHKACFWDAPTIQQVEIGLIHLVGGGEDGYLLNMRSMDGIIWAESDMNLPGEDSPIRYQPSVLMGAVAQRAICTYNKYVARYTWGINGVPVKEWEEGGESGAVPVTHDILGQAHGLIDGNNVVIGIATVVPFIGAVCAVMVLDVQTGEILHHLPLIPGARISSNPVIGKVVRGRANDIFLTTTTGWVICVAFEDGVLQIRWKTQASAVDIKTPVLLCDVNGDYVKEVVIGSGDAVVVLNGLTGQVLTEYRTANSEPSGIIGMITADDIDDDGHVELVVPWCDRGTVEVLRGGLTAFGNECLRAGYDTRRRWAAPDYSTSYGHDCIAIHSEKRYAVVQADRRWMRVDLDTLEVTHSRFIDPDTNDGIELPPANSNDMDLMRDDRIICVEKDTNTGWAGLRILNEDFSLGNVLSGFALDGIPHQFKTHRSTYAGSVTRMCFLSGKYEAGTWNRVYVLYTSGGTFPVNCNEQSHAGYAWVATAIDHYNGRYWFMERNLTNPTDTRLFAWRPGYGIAEIPNAPTLATHGTWNIMAVDPETETLVVGSTHSMWAQVCSVSGIWPNYVITKLGDLENALPDRPGGGSPETGVLSSWKAPIVNGMLYWPDKDAIKAINLNTINVDTIMDLESLGVEAKGGGAYTGETHGMVLGLGNQATAYGHLNMPWGPTQAPTLAQVVAAILEKGEFDGVVDTSELGDISIWGYVIDGSSTVASSLEPLLAAHSVYVVMSGDTLVFKRRPMALPVVTLTNDDMDAHEYGQEAQGLIAEERAEVFQRPKMLEVTYQNYEQDYRRSVAASQVSTALSDNIERIHFPFAMSSAEAATIARRLHAMMWTEGTTYVMAVPRKYLYLDAADVIEYDNGTEVLRLRVLSVEYVGTYIRLEAIPDDVRDFTVQGGSFRTAAEEHIVPEMATNRKTGRTTVAICDCSVVEGYERGAGIYVAACGAGAWGGARISAAMGSGPSVMALGDVTTRGAIGTVWVPPQGIVDRHVWDEGGTVVVVLAAGSAMPPDATRSECYEGKNCIMVGREILQYRTAHRRSDGTVALKRLLRGRFGTEGHIHDHEIGERFVHLATAEWMPWDMSARGEAYKIRATGLSLGGQEEVATEIEAMIEFRSLWPYPAIDITGERDSENGLTITWQPRPRFGGNTLDEDRIPQPDMPERYEVDILDGESTPSVLRTLTATTAEVEYTAAMQVEDGLTPGDDVEVVVYQVSSLVGRGHPSQATV